MKRLSSEICPQSKKYPEKVLQFGEGNFLRAFVDWQIAVLNKETDFNGSVVVVQPRGSEKIKRLNDQDGLFTLYLQGMKDGKEVEEHTIVNSISRGIDLFNHYEKYLELAESEELRFIISNTTEAGIYYEPTDKLCDAPQKSFPGKLTSFLYHRYRAWQGDSTKGCIIIPCELIEDNGQRLKEIVLQLADLWNLEKGFHTWIHESNIFCNSLVDRIVPGFPKDTVAKKTEELGYTDELMVVSEHYHLWAIEGPESIKEELPIDQSSIHAFIVDDLSSYRTRKVRLLNGVHSAMTPIAYLYGVDTVKEAVDHEIIGAFIKGLMSDEIIPATNLSKEELTAYSHEILARFANPYIQHYLLSIAMNSISKFKARNVPILLDYVRRTNSLPEKLVFSLSSLLYFYKGKRGEESIPLDDDPSLLEFFRNEWGAASSIDQYEKVVYAALGLQDVWGLDLNDIPGLTEKVTRNLIEIEKNGMKKALKCIVEGG
ncbi:tagaturonate reductase [Peribacillus huizhouensis]|uniref:Tagaturonate reductase n=1 Tax=Peribacillus huizhouensis TaxID=1501239 RepID=A0ABR6CND0_9BACI|nr:tagaturonate reductase [Peribacillus huizhouensis]MBA9026536.1 tagaturonate reductase [Peribacillus huizhouensis]